MLAERVNSKGDSYEPHVHSCHPHSVSDHRHGAQ
jgi:hypothetical protein